MPDVKPVTQIDQGNLTSKPWATWAAQPRQAQALCCPVWELCFGGAKGGGKTDFLLADYAQDINAWGRAWQGILFRRTYPELEEIISRALELYPFAFPGARYSVTSKTWHFPSGARLKLRHLDSIKDIHHYHGHQYAWVGWDELPRWADLQPYLEFMSIIRSPRGAPCRVRATGNPGGPAHLAVKARFIDVAPPMHVYTDPETGFDRVFIPSRLEDNIALMMGDPLYDARMRLLPEHLYKMYRWGRWDVVVGAFFCNWSNERHVIRPFRIPQAWRKFRACDWGSTKPYSVGWYAVDTEGRLYRYRELYGWGGDPNIGSKEDSRTVARRILECERGQFDEGLVEPGPGCKALFAKHDGPCPSEKMAEEGVYWTVGNDDRVQGWQECFHRLNWMDDGDRRPGFLVFDTCRHFLRTVPTLTHDERHPEDIDGDQEDHVAEEWRLACMSRPWRSYTREEQDAQRAVFTRDAVLDPVTGY